MQHVYSMVIWNKYGDRMATIHPRTVAEVEEIIWSLQAPVLSDGAGEMYLHASQGYHGEHDWSSVWAGVKRFFLTEPNCEGVAAVGELRSNRFGGIDYKFRIEREDFLSSVG